MNYSLLRNLFDTFCNELRTKISLIHKKNTENHNVLVKKREEKKKKEKYSADVSLVCHSYKSSPPSLPSNPCSFNPNPHPKMTFVSWPLYRFFPSGPRVTSSLSMFGLTFYIYFFFFIVSVQCFNFFFFFFLV